MERSLNDSPAKTGFGGLSHSKQQTHAEKGIANQAAEPQAQFRGWLREAPA